MKSAKWGKSLQKHFILFRATPAGITCCRLVPGCGLTGQAPGQAVFVILQNSLSSLDLILSSCCSRPKEGLKISFCSQHLGKGMTLVQVYLQNHRLNRRREPKATHSTLLHNVEQPRIWPAQDRHCKRLKVVPQTLETFKLTAFPSLFICFVLSRQGFSV